MSRDTENFSMYSLMSMRVIWLVVEQELGQRPRQLGLAHPWGPGR